MSSQSSTLTLEAAQTLLRKFTCLDRIPPDQIPNLQDVREALLMVREHSDYQIFGICAETADEAITSLHRYLKALHYSQVPVPEPMDGVVYLKFNPKTGYCHLDSYVGSHRGVLVSCQSAYDGDVNETFGHLPLDLWHS